MNFIFIGLASFFALVVIAFLLYSHLGWKPLWTSAAARQRAAEDKRRDQILKG